MNTSASICDVLLTIFDIPLSDDNSTLRLMNCDILAIRSAGQGNGATFIQDLDMLNVGMTSRSQLVYYYILSAFTMEIKQKNADYSEFNKKNSTAELNVDGVAVIRLSKIYHQGGLPLYRD